MKQKIFICLLIFLSVSTILYCVYLSSYYKGKSNSEVLSEDVNVTADIYACELTIRAIPEGRSAGNYSTLLDVMIYDSNKTPLGNFQTLTDDDGNSTVDLCSQRINLVKGQYNFAISGKSHLNKVFINKTGFQTWFQTLDFAENGTRLIAGEMGNIDDGEINSLDITGQIRNLNVTGLDPNYDDEYDLDMDGDIDDDDIQITINNFYKVGDTL